MVEGPGRGDKSSKERVVTRGKRQSGPALAASPRLAQRRSGCYKQDNTLSKIKNKG